MNAARADDTTASGNSAPRAARPDRDCAGTGAGAGAGAGAGSGAGAGTADAGAECEGAATGADVPCLAPRGG
eukprot:6091295-Pleurochrysis_carterae.AAC.1